LSVKSTSNVALSHHYEAAACIRTCNLVFVLVGHELDGLGSASPGPARRTFSMNARACKPTVSEEGWQFNQPSGMTESWAMLYAILCNLKGSASIEADDSTVSDNASV
jgi:hypothetical protein